MSDEEEDDYEYEYDEGEDDGDAMETEALQYTDEEEEHDSHEVALENAYYNAKGLRDTDMEAASRAFEQVISQEYSIQQKHGPWSFKALKQLVKLQLRAHPPKSSLLLQHYQRLLDCLNNGNVSPNAMEKGIHGLLERVANHPDLALPLYHVTLPVVHPVHGTCRNERLWFKTNLKYGQLLYERHDTTTLQAVLKDLQAHASPTSSTSSSTQTMEVTALQMQLYARLQDYTRLRETYKQAMSVRGGLPHPRTLALIQELGGQLYLQSKQYEAASQAFFQAFKSYDEAGDTSRLRCLKYLVLASMLHASTINPFDSQEARPYKEDAEIVAMTNLVQAFHNNDIKAFERILQQNSKRLLEDELLQAHVQDLLRTIRTQVLKRILQPYTEISLPAIAKALNNMDVAEVESLLTQLILDDQLPGASLDRVAGILRRPRQPVVSDRSTTAWHETMQAVDHILSVLDHTRTQWTHVRGSGETGCSGGGGHHPGSGSGSSGGGGSTTTAGGGASSLLRSVVH
jgi:COP9 signalosome complex subunit 2